MQSRKLFGGSLILAALGALNAPLAFAEGAIEEVVVTGSYIRGTPEDAALPVDVITAEDLEQRGAPTALDLIRAMPYITGIMGETNQFGPNQGTIGVGNVNLRGLGGMRTLVLMNGRRTTYTPAEGPAGVDTNLIPIAAIGRVEVLKDGAAATYGSDAIAGVVNFITRRDLDGLEVSGEFRDIDGSDGDWTGSVNWGWVGDRSNALLSYGRQHRSELPSYERDYAALPYAVNPTAYSGFSTPGTFKGLDNGAATFGTIRDANCADIGGYRTSGTCRFSFVPFDNMVEETDQEQIYGEINSEIADGVELHIEGLWAETTLPDYRTSPAYPPTTGPNGPGSQFSVFSDPNCPQPFCNNPGARTALAQAVASGFTTQALADATDQITMVGWRPHGWGGVPEITGDIGSQKNRNGFDMSRLGASLNGTFSEGWLEGIGWDAAVTYSNSEHTRTGVDHMITRLQAAMNGLGGESCNGIAYGLPGSNCQFFNPFSNAIARNGVFGYTNPGFVLANANSAEIKDWMIERWTVSQEQSLFVADLVFNGEIGGFELPGGAIGWAFGGQYRHTDYKASVDNPLTNSQITPCPTPNDSTCRFQTGPFIFLGQFINQNLNDSVNAVFGEISLPILDNLQAQLAVRYEDYGGLTGDTTDPKLSLRWQTTDWLAFRTSIGTTFRGPTPVNKSLVATGLQPVAESGFQYRSIDFNGNPELKPESADTFSVGMILQIGGFEAIIDYWSYEFEDQISSVPYSFIANSVGKMPGTLPAQVTGLQLANCNSPLRYLVTFSNFNTCTQGVSTGNDMQRIASPVVNGSPIETTGYDISLKYDFGDVLDFGGLLTAGIDATIVDKYEVETFVYGGVTIFKGYEAQGFGNQERWPGSVSEMRAVANINYNIDTYNFRYEVRYVEGVEDERGCAGVLGVTGVTKSCYGVDGDDYYVHNLYFNWQAPWDTTVSFAVVNVADEDPPEARHQLGYDPYIGDPLGRTFELGIKKSFAAK
jgi:iron complex outermembrane receptor protein